MICGADAALVNRAIASADPFPGSRGFAGQLPDGRLVRDVLGRVPLFVEGTLATWTSADDWAFDPTDLSEPYVVPAGTVAGPDGLDRRWTLPNPEPLPETDALDRLHGALETSLDEVVAEDLAIAFSGGVDSALLAATIDAPLYTVGFEGSNDVAAARDAAAALDANVTVRELTVPELEAAVPTVARAIDSTNAMDVQIALTLYFVAETVAADGFERVALGQGADELFGGYAKIEAVDHRVDADTVRGARREVVENLHGGLTRDTLAIRAAGVDSVVPFLHDRVVDAALRLPTSLIVSKGIRKRAFRRIASAYLPEQIARRPKKAMQYGSLVARELDRLARQAGFKRRMDDHVGQYVRSRIESADPPANDDVDSTEL
ncbi:MAG: asparagine synthase-related protein [Halanaeroarchaeum sp.]